MSENSKKMIYGNIDEGINLMSKIKRFYLLIRYNSIEGEKHGSVS